jgi:predicted DNA-binding protein (MmcQ/YjbR family)
MTNESVRTHCLSLPDTTEAVQWGEHVLFKVGGKMFAIITLDGHACTFRCDPEQYAELVEMPDIVPASHNMWTYHWVTAETLTALPDAQLRELLTASYRIVRATLPKRIRAELAGGSGKPPVARRKPRVGSRKSGVANRRSKAEKPRR